MKIRNGFVSNSSSSSFIVAFPKKPKCPCDVLEFMFKGQKGGIESPYNDENGLSYRHVAELVFEDIEKIHNNKDKLFRSNQRIGNLKNISEIFHSRYSYFPSNGYSTILYGENDGEGSWYSKIGPYYGSDKDLLRKIKDLTIKERRLIKEQDAEDKEEKRRIKVPPVPYANEKDTEEKRKAYEEYVKALKEFIANDPIYQEIKKRHYEESNKLWEEMDVLRKKLAKKDAKNFLKDNKGKFVFIVSYSDNDGGHGSQMEHGDIFRNVPHVVISNH